MNYEELVAEVQAKHPDVETGKMFGMACMKAGGKAIGGEWQGDAVFKLDEASAEHALAVPGAYMFEPMPGHAMKQWIVVPSDHSETWLDLAEAAYNNSPAGK